MPSARCGPGRYISTSAIGEEATPRPRKRGELLGWGGRSSAIDYPTCYFCIARILPTRCLHVQQVGTSASCRWRHVSPLCTHACSAVSRLAPAEDLLRTCRWVSACLAHRLRSTPPRTGSPACGVAWHLTE